MANIEILAGDHWDLAHWKIRQHLFALFPENNSVRGDRLMALYELLDQVEWEEKRVIVPYQHRSQLTGRWGLRNISFAATSFIIDPNTITVRAIAL
jgi:hypothetical protein